MPVDVVESVIRAKPCTSIRQQMSRTDNSDGQAPRKVVIVAYDGAKLMDISGPLQAFSDACFEDGHPAYQVVLTSEAGCPVPTDTRVKLETARLDDAVIDSVDTLLVAGGDLIMPASARCNRQIMRKKYEYPDLEKLRETAERAEERLRATEKRALLEIDRELGAVAKLQKDLDETTKRADRRDAEHQRAVDALQAQHR